MPRLPNAGDLISLQDAADGCSIAARARQVGLTGEHAAV